MTLLQVDEVSVRFGGVVALDRLSFAIERGNICALIGPNGAGKTTLFNCVSRLYQPTEGHILFDGRDLLTEPAHHIVRLGVARTFQNVALFPSLTVLANVMVGAHTEGSVGFGRAMARVGAGREDRRLRDSGRALLDRLGLADLADRPAAGLPFGTLKRIELARALASEPTLLLLDEPANGLTHSEVDDLGETIREIRDQFGLSILLVEHHMAMVMAISDHVVVLDFGRKIAQGPPDVVRQTPKVVEAYLGAVTRASGRKARGGGMSLLELRGVTGGYGQVRVLHGIDLVVDEGEVVVVLGANGAGKTTTLRAISGLIHTEGGISFGGHGIRGKRPEAVARAGIAHVPQGRGTFVDLTVEEDLRLGAHGRKDRDVAGDLESWLTRFPVLGVRRDQQAGSLSGGEQQMLAIARAMMSKPRLLLLDEPSLGLAPIVTQQLFAYLGELNRTTGLTILVVEQNANLALDIGDRGYVLETGRIVTSDAADALRANDAVRQAYLGF